MLTDRYGLALSTASSAARDAYVDASDRMLMAQPGAAAAFARAAAADPGFALAHAGHARALQVAGDLAGARTAIAAAEAAISGATEREASHVAVLALLAAGRPAGALDAVRAHLAAWPRDALAGTAIRIVADAPQFPVRGMRSSMSTSTVLWMSALAGSTPARCSAKPAARMDSRCAEPIRL